MLRQQACGDAVGLLHLPLSALPGDDPQAGGGGRILKPEGTLLAVEGRHDPLDDRHFGPGFEPGRDRLTRKARPRAVVGADERSG